MKWLAAPDTPFAWLCLIGALLFLFRPVRQTCSRAIFDTPRFTFNVGIALLAFGLSVAYVHTYLAGAPRIIDATTYLLQAKTLSNGEMAFSPPGGLSSFNGRFLLITPDQRLAGIFPPGFPLVLALGVGVGLPLMVNPLIGAALGVVTSELGRLWFDARTGRLAGVLSALCATLRYHSADTMSHAWSALLVLGTLLMATNPNRHPTRIWGAGVCAGWLYATRPLTGIVCIAVSALVLLNSSKHRLSHACRFAVGVLPGLVFWLIYQWTTTGTLATTQGEYYARSDFPANCFSLRFGTGTGCRHEHGDFLDTYQKMGFGLPEAWSGTMRRLSMHHMDIANLPGFGALVLACLLSVRRVPALGWLCCLIIAHMMAYALFYFDGNYPGGGARLFADILPLQHVLLAWLLVRWQVPTLGVAACLSGFALFGTHSNRQLLERDGGQPMFEAKVVERAGVSSGLLFIETDHGFNLAFDPRHAAPTEHLVSARYRGDASDSLLWRSLGRPPAYRYRFDPKLAGQPPTLESYVPTSDTLHVAGHFWPAARVNGGSAIPHPITVCGTSPSLRLVPSDPMQHTDVVLPVPSVAPFEVLVYGDGPVQSGADSGTTRELDGGCYETTLPTRHLSGTDWSLTLSNDVPRTISGVRLRPFEPTTSGSVPVERNP